MALIAHWLLQAEAALRQVSAGQEWQYKHSEAPQSLCWTLYLS